MPRLQRPFAIPLLRYIYEREASKLSILGNYKFQPHTINGQKKSLDPSLTANIQFLILQLAVRKTTEKKMKTFLYKFL